MVSLLQRHLESEGWTVTTATSGADALTLLEGDGFDVILTDVVMDGVDGLAVLRALKRLQSPARVILMTAFARLEWSARRSTPPA